MSRRDNNTPAFEIVDVQIFERPGTALSEMFYRSYDLEGGNNVIRDFQDMVHQYPGTLITENELVNNTPELISMSHRNSGGVYIPNGWNVNRLSFVIKVIETVSPSLEKHYFIQGYTDYHDTILGMRDNMNIRDVIDGNTRFEINGYTIVHVVIDSQGGVHPTIKDRISILVTPEGEAQYNSEYGELDDILGSENSIDVVRPKDIITDIYFNKAYDNSGPDSGSNDLNTIKTTSRTNTGSVGYVAEIINGAIKSKEVERTSTYNNRGNDRDNAIAGIKSVISDLTVPTHTQCPFIYHLYCKSRDINTTSFTLDDLYDMQPDIDHMATFYSANEYKKDMSREVQMLVDRGESGMLDTQIVSDTDGKHVNTRIVLEFLNLITSFMTDSNITKALVLLSNDPSRTLEPIAEVFQIGSIIDDIFASEDARRKLEKYIGTVILNKLSLNSERPIHINAIVDLKDMTSISVAVNADRYEEAFRFNSAADGRYSPHISDIAGRNSISSSIGTILDIIRN